MTINNKSERNYRGKCLGWPVTSYGGDLEDDYCEQKIEIKPHLRPLDLQGELISIEFYLMGW